MLPVIALIGRPNVGKSTLFNRFTGTRDALVADYPGLTRDRLYGFSCLKELRAIVIDTGGITGDRDDMSQLMQQQVELAVDEADAIVLLADAQDGLTGGDQFAADLIRKTGKPLVLAVNKAEGQATEDVAADFYELGLDEPVVCSAQRGDRISVLVERLHAACPALSADAKAPVVPEGLRVAVVGRPNVGKSTLINRYLGEERLVASNQAGTTRDSIYVPFESDGQKFVLVDTAGIRRRAKVHETVEKYSVVKALQAIDDADAVIMLFDAHEGISEQDVSLVGLVLDRGRPLAIGINKWDGLHKDERHDIREALDRRLPFLDFVRRHTISALHGSAIYELLESAVEAAECARTDLPTHRLSEVLTDALTAHPPPLVRGRRAKLSFAHQGGKRPPVIVVHGNQTESLPGSYRRYLVNHFRKAFRLRGTPIRLQLKSSRNPFAGKRNTLTPRQIRSRKRIRTRAKGKKR
ncbi:MAG: ribosome biogenesis GTPase Der [Gammaproteobacteria bacterium]